MFGPPANRLLQPALLSALVAVAPLLFAGEPTAGSSSTPAPFLRLRESTLGYHGPAEDFTDLTEIRIGWFGPTDPADPLTGDLWWAARLAFAEAEEDDCVGSKSSFAQLPLRVIPRWSVDVWGTGVSQLTRMVYDEQPLALIGSIDSSSTHLAEQVVAKAHLPLVSPIATDPSITIAGVAWMFSCAPSDQVIARTLVDELFTALDRGNPENKRHFVLLATTDHESRMTTREVTRELARRGRLPDLRVDLPPGEFDLSLHLRAVAAAAPSHVIIIAGAEDAARLVQAVRAELGPIPILGGPSLGRRRFMDLAGAAAEGVCFPLLFNPDLADARTSAFVARFARERGYPPDYVAAFSYDGTRLLVEAIRRAGPNRARIRETLVQLSPWPGIAGPIQFDGTGQNTRADLCLGTIRNGAAVPVPAISSSSIAVTVHHFSP